MPIPLSQLRAGHTVVVERFVPLLDDTILIRLPTKKRLQELFGADGTKNDPDANALFLAECLTDDDGERMTPEQARGLLADMEANNSQAVMNQIIAVMNQAMLGEGSDQGEP